MEVRQSASVNSFKQSLNKNKTHVPKYYYSGSRQGQILHVRLRTNCSALNLDLFMRNITDSPLCRCGSIEDSQHFFFHCPYFQAPRYDLLNAVSQYQTPTLSSLLYGDTTLSNEINRVFLKLYRSSFYRLNAFVKANGKTVI